MARKKKENPNQLKLFMTPQEIMENYKPISGDFLNGETTDELWERKANEAKDNGLLDSIRENGVQIPVSLGLNQNTVQGGHHRIAAQHRLNPNQFIPVNYENNPGTAQDYDWAKREQAPMYIPRFDKSDYAYER